MAQDPREIVKVEDFPDKETPAGRKGIPEFIRRRITRADGSYETFEYDPETPPPADLPPENPSWGRSVGHGIDPQQRAAYTAAAKAEQAATRAGPETHAGGPAGLVVWNPATNRFESVQGTQPRDPGQTPTNVNGVFYQLNPTTGRMEAIGSDPGTLAARQAAEDRAAAAEQRAATKDQAQAEIDRINALRQAKQIDDAEAERQWQRWWKENVEAPMEREKLNLQLAQEERVNQTAVGAAGQQAGQNRVADIVASIPYRFSGGFLQGRQQMLDAGQRGTYGPATAVGPIQMPDLVQQRAAAEQQGQQSAAARLGVELPPAADAFAGVPPYSGPMPEGTIVPTPEDQAAEWAKRLAGVRHQLFNRPGRALTPAA